MLRVLLVEDNRIFREALKQDLCERFPAIIGIARRLSG